MTDFARGAADPAANHMASSSADLNDVGVVVIGKNEGNRLALCLASLKPSLPVVYADSASTDDSVEIASRQGAQVIVLSEDRALTAARGRNAGARECLNLHENLEYIQFVDGDCEVAKDWIPIARQFLETNPQVAVVCGRRSEIAPDRSIYHKLIDREWNTPVGKADASGGDSLVRVSAFAQVGGFDDEQVAHEEPEFCARLRQKGWQVWRIDAAMTSHDADMTRLTQFYRRSRRGGYGIGQVILRKQASSDRAARQMFARAWLWAGLVPVAIIVATFVDWRLALGLTMLVGVQWMRMFAKAVSRQGFGFRDAGKVATLNFISKFGELHGILEYCRDRMIAGERKSSA